MTALRAASATAGSLGAAWTLRHAAAPPVRGWSRPTGERTRRGPLAVRALGSGGADETVVLLHGLVASGDSFGACFDVLAADRCLLVPDLLGFGASLDTQRTNFTLDAHLAALDGLVVDAPRPLVVAGHSMGSVLALVWAARRDDVRRVVALSPPLYRDEAEARRHIGGMGMFERLLALRSPLSEAVCRWMCAHRRMAGWGAVALQPQWPVPIAHQGVQHTWPSYLGGMEEIILRGPWSTALDELDRRAVSVALAAGTDDPVVVPGRLEHLAATHQYVSTHYRQGAGHDLPQRDAAWCAALV